MSDIHDAIDVQSTILIDYEDLGAGFAHQDSISQADFFRGFTREITNWNYVLTDHQLCYIAESLRTKYGDDVTADVAEVLSRIAGFLRGSDE